MARAGVSLVQRQAVRDACFGIDLVSKAASMGSDLASYSLGQWHEEGSHGLPHDLAEAKCSGAPSVPACTGVIAHRSRLGQVLVLDCPRLRHAPPRRLPRAPRRCPRRRDRHGGGGVGERRGGGQCRD
mmetsp:Transcript_49795/g.157554  ORF Transcript_49795/g.157554 Transcript_49795/m.157554 type:complete len:128 (-) Transcript_49795:327-710(-)